MLGVRCDADIFKLPTRAYSIYREVYALPNFNDIISNVNINGATQLLFDRINTAFKLTCPIQTKTLSPKNTTKQLIPGEIKFCTNMKKRQINYSLVRQNKM